MKNLINFLFKMSAALMCCPLWGAPLVENNQVSLKFPAVSTILSVDSIGAILALVAETKGSNVCYMVRGYYSNDHDSKTYRIVGRARVLEVYRQLVLAGVDPRTVSISSLGPINENREYRGNPPGYVVVAKFQPKTRYGCTSENSFAIAGQNFKQEHSIDELILDYPILDADPVPDDLERLLIQIRLRAGSDGRLTIVAYDDKTGSVYLNRVLSRLRALVIFRQATLAGYPAKNIELESKGAVLPTDSGLPPPIVEAQRRTMVRFVPPKIAPVTASVNENPPQTQETPDEGDPQPKSRIPEGWFLGLFAGPSTPPSSISKNVKLATVYGLAIRKKTPSMLPGFGVEGLYSSQKHARAKENGVSGQVTIRSFRLGGEYEIAECIGGVILGHGGLSAHRWAGNATYEPNGETNRDSGSDYGIYAGVGHRFGVLEHFYAEPRIELDAARRSLEGWKAQLLIEFGWRS